MQHSKTGTPPVNKTGITITVLMVLLYSINGPLPVNNTGITIQY